MRRSTKPFWRRHRAPTTTIRLSPEAGARLDGHQSMTDGDIAQQQIAPEAAPALHFRRRRAHRTCLPKRCGEMNVKSVWFSRALIVHCDGEEIVNHVFDGDAANHRYRPHSAGHSNCLGVK